jgi:hypothetical protein
MGRGAGKLGGEVEKRGGAGGKEAGRLLICCVGSAVLTACKALTSLLVWKSFQRTVL